MSFQAMTWATEQELPAMQKIVLLMMANRTNHETGLCFPSHDLLAKECGMSTRSVIRQINELVAGGFLFIVHSVNSNGASKSNRYRLNLNFVRVTESHGGDRESLGGVTESHSGVTESHRGGDRESLGGVTESHPNQEYITRKEPVSINNSVELSGVSKKLSETVQFVFDKWRQVMNHEKSALDKKRRNAICNALKLGYSAKDLILAIEGCAKTPHNMGCNDRQQRYDGIELIFRSADQIDRFIHNFHHPPVIPKQAVNKVSSINSEKSRPCDVTHSEFDKKYGHIKRTVS